MPFYSNSPLGLVLTSESNDSPVIGKYAISNGKNNELSSIFFDDNDKQSYKLAVSGYKTQDTDISTTGLVDYTSKHNSMKLKYSDFAYLKNLGVYPNNRLVIARRFPSPVSDDLTAVSPAPSPLSTLI